MTRRYWVIGGEYEGADFNALVPGTEKLVGPFENEGRARTEWTRLSCSPAATATTRYSIAAEAVR
ncbi:DUF4170 domain-containing protein [Sphingosinicella rhizophila]|uniref:DUF4170 domain-containing protein n=1 Tax=Sphingosinicella rhizophila TaxID=3050082 RepID=A0ABU3Q7Y4_9SPHN|nr:hypothetical protein [Sphingosinicella sp. GR2756]MDT9599523.1 hypothetical protein [Sphingosinicella sp. GR2756]